MTALVPLSSMHKKRLVLLAVICCAQFTAVFHYFHFFRSNGYLPPPFLFDKHDTFMDFFNPAFWSTSEGRYREWNSIYPPLNFVVLKFLRWIFTGDAIIADAFALRYQTPVLQILIVLTYLAAPLFVVTRTYWDKFSVAERTLLYIAFIGCAPFLFALERGNLIILSFFMLPFLFSKFPMSRLVAIALLVNLKPYFLILLLGYVVKRQWNDLAMGVAMTGCIYLLTGLLIGSDPLAMPNNVLNFSQNPQALSLKEVLAMPSSISAIAYVFRSDVFQTSKWSALPITPDMFAALIEWLNWAVIACAVLMLWRKQSLLSLSECFAICLAIISNMGISVGGYTLINCFIALPILSDMRWARVYLGLLFMLAMPLDFLVVLRGQEHIWESFFSHSIVNVPWLLSVGSFVRPAASFLLLATLVTELMARQSKAASIDVPSEPSSSFTFHQRDSHV